MWLVSSSVHRSCVNFARGKKVRLFFRIWGNRGDDHDVVSKRVGRFFGRLTVAAGVIPSLTSPPLPFVLSSPHHAPIQSDTQCMKNEGRCKTRGRAEEEEDGLCSQINAMRRTCDVRNPELIFEIQSCSTIPHNLNFPGTPQ